MSVNIHTALISDADPFGDVTLVPAQILVSEVRLACYMADALIAPGSPDNDEAIMVLDRLFPNAPLTVRVAALGALMR